MIKKRKVVIVGAGNVGTKRKSGRTASGNREEIATGDRRYLPAFRTVRRMYVSESAL